MIRTSQTHAATSEVFPTPHEIVSFLDKHIVGQDDAKLALATAVYSHYLMAASAQGKGSTGRRKTANLLLAGPTGTGKSETVRWIAEYLDVPFVEMPATALTQEGYVGKKPEDIIRALLAAADWDSRRAEYGIVFVDEIDKIRRSGPTGSLDVSGAGVQMSLLPFLDGTTYSVIRGEVSHTVNTQHVLIVAAGAFQLPSSKQESRQSSATDESRNLSINDLADYGLIDEFVGRFSRVVNLQTLTIEQLKQILVTSPTLKEQRELFGLHDVELQVTSSAAGFIAEQARQSGKGARPLAAMLKESLQEAVAGLPYLPGTNVLLSGDSLSGLRLVYEGSPHSGPTTADRIRRVLPKLIGANTPRHLNQHQRPTNSASRSSDCPTLTLFSDLEENINDYQYQ